MTFRKKLAMRLLALLTLFTAIPIGSVGASKTETNLVAGLPYTTYTGVGIEHSYKKSETETPDEAGKLTDGKRASTLAYDNEAWHKCYRGYTRTVEFELPEVKAVTGFSVSLLHSNAAGLPMPPSFDLYVSEDGKDYMLAYSRSAKEYFGAGSTARRNITARDIGRYRAKYVRITFRCEVSVYIDEIEVYGNDVDGTEAAFVKYHEDKTVLGYDEGIEGCREMVLLYCGYKGTYNDDFVNNTEEKLLPYFGYIAKDGTILDTMFDSFMFSALGGNAPSGGSLDPSKQQQATKEDWEYFLNSIFDETYNCGAIERIMERVKTATGKTDARVSLVINVPFPTKGGAPFGDINGDGVIEYCRTTEDQLAIYRWFFDQVEAKFAERNYQSIRFGGYYWGSESLHLESEEEEAALLGAFADEIHKRGDRLFWIPLLYGDGFTRARELGFDCAMMQPNYAFLNYSDEKCFAEIDEAIRKYGLGIEIEVHWNAIKTDEDLGRYYTYLNAGYALGYAQNTSHSYYQNSAPGTFYQFAISNSQKLRNAYEDTYAFVKRTYVPRTVRLDVPKLFSVKSGKTRIGSVKVADGCYAASLGAPEWVILSGPEHGTVEIDATGMFRYTSEEGYEGNDSFVVCLKAEYASSEEATVNLVIHGDETGVTSEETSEGLSTTEESEAKKNIISVLADAITGGKLVRTSDKGAIGVVVGVVAGGAAIVAAGVGTVLAVLKKKKKK